MGVVHRRPHLDRGSGGDGGAGLRPLLPRGAGGRQPRGRSGWRQRGASIRQSSLRPRRRPCRAAGGRRRRGRARWHDEQRCPALPVQRSHLPCPSPRAHLRPPHLYHTRLTEFVRCSSQYLTRFVAISRSMSAHREARLTSTSTAKDVHSHPASTHWPRTPLTRSRAAPARSWWRGHAQRCALLPARLPARPPWSAPPPPLSHWPAPIKRTTSDTTATLRPLLAEASADPTCVCSAEGVTTHAEAHGSPRPSPRHPLLRTAPSRCPRVAPTATRPARQNKGRRAHAADTQARAGRETGVKGVVCPARHLSRPGPHPTPPFSYQNVDDGETRTHACKHTSWTSHRSNS
jgi:hypothetical protein